jgi:hypothetical protein
LPPGRSFEFSHRPYTVPSRRAAALAGDAAMPFAKAAFSAAFAAAHSSNVLVTAGSGVSPGSSYTTRSIIPPEGVKSTTGVT